MHCATSEDAYTKAWFHNCRSIFPQSVRKGSPDVDFYNGSTYQCSILFNNMVSFNRRVTFGKQRMLISQFLQKEQFNVTIDPQLSVPTEFWENNYAHVILTAEADSLPTDARELPHVYGFVGCHSTRRNDLSVHARIDSSRFFRLLWESTSFEMVFDVKFCIKRQIEQLKHRARVRLNNSSTTWSLLH